MNDNKCLNIAKYLFVFLFMIKSQQKKNCRKKGKFKIAQQEKSVNQNKKGKINN